MVVNLTGSLAKDCDELMPQATQQAIEGYWRNVQLRLGAEFNFDFWRLNQPWRSTYMSCRASIAAGYQGEQNAMIEAKLPFENRRLNNFLTQRFTHKHYNITIYGERENTFGRMCQCSLDWNILALRHT